MTISISQLETWTRQGAIDASARAYASIRAALAAYKWSTDASYDVYLQGSYGNDTNIRGNSDVDIVVQLNSTFRSDISLLSPIEKEIYKTTVASATYGFTEFKHDVKKALSTYYGWLNIEEHSKSIKVTAAPASGGLSVDVVPCIQFRSYFKFVGGGNQFIEGMTFAVGDFLPDWIVNYPKLHRVFGTEKHQNTNGMFKRYVRLFKNVRSARPVSLLDSDTPSYFIECLLSQVPDGLFVTDLQNGYVNLVNWMYAALQSPMASALLCQNRMLPIFGDRQEQWQISEARKFVNRMISFWQDT